MKRNEFLDELLWEPSSADSNWIFCDMMTQYVFKKSDFKEDEINTQKVDDILEEIKTSISG